MMTIAQFADRTGLTPSTLRFYEQKGLLTPHRLANGYRVYAEEQVNHAQLIGSLRQAGVALAEIRQFLVAGLSGREVILAHWRKEVAARLLSIQIASRYLGGMAPGQNEVHLVKWDDTVAMLWFREDVPLGPLPFAPAVARRQQELEHADVAVLSGGYVRPQELREGDRLVGEVGFQVKLKRDQPLPAGARQELVPPTLFVTLACMVADRYGCDRVFQFIRQFGFQPVGGRMERYLAGSTERYQLMIAVTRAEG